jgi:hypothetical protein
MKKLIAVSLALFGYLLLSSSGAVAYSGDHLFPRFTQYTQEFYNSSKQEWGKPAYVIYGYFNSIYPNRLDSISSYSTSSSKSHQYTEVFNLDAVGNYYTSRFIRNGDVQWKDTFTYDNQDQISQISSWAGGEDFRRAFIYSDGQLVKMMTYASQGFPAEWVLLAEDSLEYDVTGKLISVKQKQMDGTEFKVVHSETWSYGEKGNLLQILRGDVVDGQFVPVTRLMFEGTDGSQSVVLSKSAQPSIRYDGTSIQITGVEPGSELSLSDVSGRIVRATTLGSGVGELHTAGLPAGPYFLTSERRLLRKLIIR